MGNMGLPAGSENCVNLLYSDYASGYKKVDKEGITKLLRNVARQQPDITIALLHWGSEHNDNISSTQKTILKLMAQEGVDAIIGTHPHRVQQMGFDADTGIFVAYSLGDFFGDAARSYTGYSVILDLEITKDNVTGQTRITGYDYVPIYTVTDAESGAPIKVLRIREAIAAYEAQIVGMVDERTYQSMRAALADIEGRIQGK
jgi:poly-gamma-glutamate synthesis protein (capsule biosynthesis protein)